MLGDWAMCIIVAEINKMCLHASDKLTLRFLLFSRVRRKGISAGSSYNVAISVH